MGSCILQAWLTVASSYARLLLLFFFVAAGAVCEKALDHHSLVLLLGVCVHAFRFASLFYVSEQDFSLGMPGALSPILLVLHCASSDPLVCIFRRFSVGVPGTPPRHDRADGGRRDQTSGRGVLTREAEGVGSRLLAADEEGKLLHAAGVLFNHFVVCLLVASSIAGCGPTDICRSTYD